MASYIHAVLDVVRDAKTLGFIAGGTAYAAYKLLTFRDIPDLQCPPRKRSGLFAFVMGHAAEILEHNALVGKGFVDWYEDNTRAVQIRLFCLQRVHTVNPKDAEYILGFGAKKYRKGQLYKALARVIGYGLVTLFSDEEHAAHRREVSAAFSPAALRRIADTAVPTHAKAMLDTLHSACGAPAGTVKIQDVLTTAALRVIAQAAFRTESEASLRVVEEAYDEAMRNGWTPFRLVWLFDKCLFWRNYKIQCAKAKMGKLVQDIQAQSKNSSADVDDTNAKALIDFLIHSKKLTTGQIIDHSITFMFAGYDTTSNALTWMCYLLSKNPDIQERLYEELCACIGKDTVPRMDDVKHCNYLYWVIKESLRLKGPVSLIARYATEDDVLPGTKQFVPKGAYIVIPFVAIHHSKQLYGEDADVFRPERWEDAELEERVGLGGYLPFSMGKRNCIGKEFAMNEMALLGATVFRNFKLDWPVMEPEPEPYITPIYKPKVPFNVEISERQV